MLLTKPVIRLSFLRGRRFVANMSAKPLNGNVKLKYLSLGHLGGRGGVVRNMLFVHNIAFKEISIPRGEPWSKAQEELIASGDNPTGKVPVLYIDDIPYHGHIPILKYIASKVDAEIADQEVRYRSDVILDEYTNWRNEWAATLSDETVKKIYPGKREAYYALIEKLYERRLDKTTPYFTGGEKPGYEDLCVYGIVYDDQQTYGDMQMDLYPTLKALQDKIKGISKIAEWLKAAVPISAAN